ncbi:hypothetical protein [Peristeroidobacter soli]|uniref:hypothetical protein n=1 Tax=Peristeroidobacter soli TaxID=2497877 RepID=UPI00101D6E45|nr:hypothetical protein [Peristeroidobacter soli]
MTAAVDRVAAIVQPRIMQPRAGERRALPTPGETLLLTLAEAAGDDLLVTMANGTELRLMGLNRLSEALRPGDTLMMQVLATEPHLELAFRDTPAASSNANSIGASAPPLTQYKAMQLDQAVLKQIAWQLPDPAALSTAWRLLAQEHWTRSPGEQWAHATGAHWARAADFIGADSPGPRAGTAALFREPAFMANATTHDRWVLPVYAWAGMQLMLRLVVAIDRARRKPQRKGLPLALQLGLSPPSMGGIVLHIQSAGEDDVELVVACEQRPSLLAIQQALPGIASALSRAGLRLRRAQVTQGNAVLSVVNENSTSMLPPHLDVELPSPSLFRSAAEAAIVILQLRPRPELSQATR